MLTNSSLCSTYEYGEAEYWDARYMEEAGASFDWYQRYTALRPFFRKFIPSSFRILVVGCGNSLMSEDMVKDGYVDIFNIDISYIVIEMLRKSYAHVPQLKCILFWRPCDEIVGFLLYKSTRLVSLCDNYVDMQMDVRHMSFFDDESFDSVIDKGTLDSLMCGTVAPLSASQMINEVNRLLKPGGIFMLITYGDPSVRIPHLNQTGCCWKITLYIISRPGFRNAAAGSSSLRSVLEPVALTEKGQISPDYVLEDPDSHYIYVCEKMERSSEPIGL